ncbi:hypothetical protein J3998_12390, partial [Thiomicrorhabdus sp. 6S2-11]
MLALEQTQDRSTIIAALQVGNQTEAEQGQELPLEGQKSPFAQFLDYLKSQSVASDNSSTKLTANAVMTEQVDVGEQHSISAGLERLLNTKLAVAEDGDVEDEIALHSRLKDVFRDLQGYTATSAMKVEAPDLDTAQAMQITAAGTATNRLQQLPAGWGQSLQNELAAMDLGAEADQNSASNTGSVLNALANRLQVAYPEFAQQPREQIVARLRSELLAQSSVVSESETDELTQKLQTAVQNMAQEAGVDVDVKVAFGDFPERPVNQLHETAARVANVVADENRQPLQQREKLATEAVKVDLSKAAQGLNVDNTGKLPANHVEVNTANESVTKVLNNKVADVAQTKHRHVDAESIQGKVRVEENTARAEQIVGKEAENQVAMVEANRQQALEKSNGMAQQGIEESTSKQANSALDAQFDAELTVQAEVKTEAKFEQEITASEQHAVQTHQLAQDGLVIEEELTDEAVVASVGFAADQVVQKLQGKAADKVDEGKLADEAESVQQVEEITDVAALHAGQATASAQANVQVQTAANVGAQTSAAASISPQANSQANVQANANATMNASGSTENLAGQS